MNISTVAQNLRNTIAVKEQLLSEYTSRFSAGDIARLSAMYSTVEFLKINIDELKKILSDVEQCIDVGANDSWIAAPDRSGGQFTNEEINRGEW